MDATQVAVIGGGPGGYVAAFRAADLGLQVSLIDLDPNPGGVCLYRGCIPSKALLHIAKLITESRKAAEWGITFSEPQIDLIKLNAFKDRVIAKMTGGLGQLAKARKVDFIQGHAAFVSANELSIAGADGIASQLCFENAILASGSRPTVLPLFDISSDRVMDSTAALELADIPKSLLVVGGGIVGLELGSVYAALGSSVSVVEMLPDLVPPADRDLVKPLQNRLESQFEEIHVNTKVTAIEETQEGIDVSFGAADGKIWTKTYSKLLVSIGRQPNTEDLGLEKTRVQLGEGGFVSVDDQRRTAESNIFAIGDIIGSGLAHTASHEGAVAADVIAGKRVAFQPNAIPNVVYTDPEIAWCGITEAEAKARGIDVDVDPTEYPSGRFALLHDAEQNAVQLWQPA